MYEGAILSANELNFSGGPGALPAVVLKAASQAIQALPETGVSVLGMSHRSAWFKSLLEQATANIRRVIDIPDQYHVLFLQGGSSLQFSMAPMNFARQSGAHADYVTSGYWSRKAVGEAKAVVDARVVWDGAATGFSTLPVWSVLRPSSGAAYFHYVSNETVEGLQFKEPPADFGCPLIVDMSSDFLSRRIDVSRYAMIYAHAQKNLGPAGVTVAIIHDDLVGRIPDGLPPMLDYRTHIKHQSNYNTPPVFSIYVLDQVTRWLMEDVGGIDAMQALNRRKADTLLACLQRNAAIVDLHAAPESRSMMNVAFTFKSPELNQRFIDEASASGFSGLGGHRSIGGLRASLYNAVSEAAVAQLAHLIDVFCSRYG